MSADVILDFLCIGVGVFLLGMGLTVRDFSNKVLLLVAAAVIIGSTAMNWDFKGARHESVAADQSK